MNSYTFRSIFNNDNISTKFLNTIVGSSSELDRKEAIYMMFSMVKDIRYYSKRNTDEQNLLYNFNKSLDMSYTPEQIDAMNIDPYIGLIVDGKWKIIRCISSGSTGYVFDVEDVDTEIRYVMKISRIYHSIDTNKILELEYENYNRIKELDFFPSIYAFGNVLNRNYLVIERMDCDIFEISTLDNKHVVFLDSFKSKKTT